mgnify:FL=1
MPPRSDALKLALQAALVLIGTLLSAMGGMLVWFTLRQDARLSRIEPMVNFLYAKEQQRSGEDPLAEAP